MNEGEKGSKRESEGVASADGTSVNEWVKEMEDEGG